MADSAAEARAALDAAGTLPDAELDLAGIALQFGRIDAPEADWHAAREHLSELARAAVAVADAPDPEARRQALVAILHGRFSYVGDSTHYDDLANANLLQVIARRRGLPVALGILWLHTAEAAGWAAHGIDFPGHFLLGMPAPGGSAVIDVFAGGTPLGAPVLRAMLKAQEGSAAELHPALLAPMPRRAVLLRLQNNIKLRRLRVNDLPGGLVAVEDMLRLAPEHALLWREAGLLNQRLDRIGAALQCCEHALALTPEGPSATRLRGLLDELRQRLN